jgi:hypothetical protein
MAYTTVAPKRTPSLPISMSGIPDEYLDAYQDASKRLAGRKFKVKILNPMPGGSPYTGVERALRFVKAGRGYIDSCNRLVFYGHSTGNTSGELDVVDRFSGIDAFPERAVFPPSPEALHRMGSKRSVLRPPLRSSESSEKVR